MLLAELCSLIAGFQIMMFYETALPSLGEVWYSDVLLSLWGVSCLAVACSYIMIMVSGGIMSFGIMKESETDGSLPPFCSLKAVRLPSPSGVAPRSMPEEEWRKRQYPHDDRGAILYPEQFQDKWRAEFDREFIALIRYFSIGIPAFLINLAITILVKFDPSSPPARWTGFGTALIGCLTWWKWWHSSVIPHLTV